MTLIASTEDQGDRLNDFGAQVFTFIPLKFNLKLTFSVFFQSLCKIINYSPVAKNIMDKNTLKTIQHRQQ